MCPLRKAFMKRIPISEAGVQKVLNKDLVNEWCSKLKGQILILVGSQVWWDTLVPGYNPQNNERGFFFCRCFVLFCSVFCFFEIGSHAAKKAGLELSILVHPLPEYRYIPSRPLLCQDKEGTWSFVCTTHKQSTKWATPPAQCGTGKEWSEWTCISQLCVAIMKYLRQLTYQEKRFWGLQDGSAGEGNCCRKLVAWVQSSDTI